MRILSLKLCYIVGKVTQSVRHGGGGMMVRGCLKLKHTSIMQQDTNPIIIRKDLNHF